MHGETHESAKGRGDGVTGCRYGLVFVQFGSASDLTRLYPQDATRETSAGTSRSECQKTLQVCCRLQARISTAVPSTQTIAESTIQNMAEYGVCWYDWNLNIIIACMKNIFFDVSGYSFCTFGNCGLVTCQIPGEAVQLDSACRALLGCVPTRCEVEKRQRNFKIWSCWSTHFWIDFWISNWLYSVFHIRQAEMHSSRPV